VKARLLRLQDIALCFVRKWWRPVSCIGLAASVWVNLVLIPWWKTEPVQFDKAGLFVSAIVAAFAVREIGKIKGVKDD
jgi:hypothetical protein